jgi:hypothetical protein
LTEYLRAYDAQITDASQIDPDKWYARGCFEQFLFHRGRKMSEALGNDPLAPPQHRDGANKAILVKGSDVLAYLASYGDGLIDYTVEINKRLGDAVRSAQRKFDLDRKQMLAENETQKRKAARDALEAVYNFIDSNTIDITQHASATCGIYFLRFEGRIVYVGQSRSVYSRLSMHKAEKTKKFDRVTFFPCAMEKLNEFEGFFINLLEPKYNGGKMGPSFGAPRSNLWNDVIELFVTDLDQTADRG